MVDPVEVVPQSRHPEKDPLVQTFDDLFFVRVDVGLGRHQVVSPVRAVSAADADAAWLRVYKLDGERNDSPSRLCDCQGHLQSHHLKCKTNVYASL